MHSLVMIMPVHNFTREIDNSIERVSAGAPLLKFGDCDPVVLMPFELARVMLEVALLDT